MEDSRDFNLVIPQMRITDYPQIGYRAVHFDNKHHLDRTEYYYRTIDKLASYKINAVIWEIDDKLRFTRHAEIGAPNALSKQEVRAISRYAKERNIEITPLVQGLGHAGYILKHHWNVLYEKYLNMYLKSYAGEHFWYFVRFCYFLLSCFYHKGHTNIFLYPYTPPYIIIMFYFHKSLT